MGVGLKYSDNNRLWLKVYTRSFVSCPILGAFKGLCLSSLDNCSENYNRSSDSRYRGLQVGCQVANAGHSCDGPIR